MGYAQAFYSRTPILRKKGSAFFIRYRKNCNKFFAPIARHHIGRPLHQGRQTLRHCTQAMIAFRVPIVVVKFLEMIYIRNDDGKPASVPQCPTPFDFQRFIETSPVRDAGKAIDMGKSFHLLGFGLEFLILFLKFYSRFTKLKVSIDSRPYNGRIEGLCNVIDRTQLDAFQFAFHIRNSRDKYHRYPARPAIRPQAPHNLIPIHLRHHDIQQDQVRLGISRSNFQCQSAIQRRADNIVVFKRFFQRINILRDVIYDQNR